MFVKQEEPHDRLFQSILEFSVPHAVDQRIQHRGDECVNHRYYLAPLRRVTGAGTQVNETCTSVLQEDHSQVGGTGREGFAPPLGGTDLQDGIYNEDIGQSDEEERDGEDDDTDHKQGGLMDMGVCTGQSHDREDITVEQADFLTATERQPEDEHGQLHGQDEPQQQGPQGQLDTQVPAHDEGVAQRVTDGHKPVIGHDGQQDAVSTAQEDEEEHLGTTACQGDHSSLCRQDAGQSQRSYGRRIEDLQASQVCQEEVHRGVETPIGPGGEDDGHVSSNADQVHHEEDHKDQHLHLGESGEGAEVEEDHPSLISFFHVFSTLGLLLAHVTPLTTGRVLLEDTCHYSHRL